MTPPTRYTLFAGVDIAATSAEVALATSPTQIERSFSMEQSPAGRQTLMDRLRATGHEPGQTLVVLEATGTYWMELALSLHQAGWAVSVINPAQAHYFAQSLLKRSKTDALDAQLLARLAATLQPDPWSPPPAIYEELVQRLTERQALLDMRQQERNRLHALRQRPVVIPPVQQRMEAHLHFLDTQIKAIEGELRAALTQDSAWAAAAQLLLSITGIGLITAAWLLTATLGFTACSTPEQVTAFAGLAPRERRSGTSLQARASIGHAGHAHLRTALYMATLSAAQHNPLIAAFYSRLRQHGKPVKVARCAAARKLLHIAWAVVTHHHPFDPTYAQVSVPPNA